MVFSAFNMVLVKFTGVHGKTRQRTLLIPSGSTGLLVSGFLCKVNYDESFEEQKGFWYLLKSWSPQVLDSLKAVGIASIPSSSDPSLDTTFLVHDINRKWARGLGDSATVTYTPEVTVSATQNYTSQDSSQFETIHHIYAKQVKVKVSWNFKGSTQSIEVSSVIR